MTKGGWAKDYDRELEKKMKQPAMRTNFKRYDGKTLTNARSQIQQPNSSRKKALVTPRNQNLTMQQLSTSERLNVMNETSNSNQ